MAASAPLYVDAAAGPVDGTEDSFRCYQGGFMFDYDLAHIKAAIGRGDDVRDWADMPSHRK